MKFESNKKEALKMLEGAENDALEGIGQFLVEAVRPIVPVAGESSGDGRYKSSMDPDKVTRPGLLRDSYTYNIDAKNKQVSVGSNIVFANTVESGSSSNPAQPHLMLAAEENISAIRDLGGKLMQR